MKAFFIPVLMALATACSSSAPKTERDAIKDSIGDQRSGVKSCYEDALLRNPDTKGKLELSWMIQPLGQVKNVAIVSSTLNDRALEDCVAKAMMKARFPESTVGQLVTYPFVFQGKTP